MGASKLLYIGGSCWSAPFGHRIMNFTWIDAHTVAVFLDDGSGYWTVRWVEIGTTTQDAKSQK